MKDFDEFLALIDGDTIEALCNDANLKISNLSNSADIGSLIGTVSICVAIELIGLYHKWISDEN